ncbi:MAG: HAMP domain-containing sensor histidine kinase [Ferruginibacter sp.]|nr:HAMP domain-containing sensor histidine kinase [Ferruginibacter sp.]
MKLQRVKFIVLIGIIAFVGIIAIQVYWLKQAFAQEEKKFSQNIQVSLLDVVNGVNKYYGYKAPLVNPVQKLSGDYYVVNIHNDFDADVLEFYLTNTFVKRGITTDYEYAIYDCETDGMVYGSYVNMNLEDRSKPANVFPKAKNLVYYFAIRFPDQQTYLFASVRLWALLSVIMIIVLVIYLYSIYVILQQQKYANRQRDFINNMTHEFKTPLSSILIASNYLAQQPAIVNDPKLEKYTSLIIGQSKKLDGHVEKVLNLAKNDVRPLKLEKAEVDISEIISAAIEIIKVKYPAAEVNFTAPSKPMLVSADAFHFGNVVYNILDNAAKYCTEKPVIQINVREEKTSLMLEFIDNGIGIAEKELKHIAEKFYRVNNDQTKLVNGFGLGLYYVSNICRLHQWKISFHSAFTRGTKICLTIKK